MSRTKGLTTAANIWITATLGMAIGIGFYLPAIIIFLLVPMNLVLVSKIKSKFFKKKLQKKL